MSTEEEAHSQRVTQFIAERIEAAGGWLPFDEFMALALYAPGLGYYSAGGVKIGRGGDFTTAPEVSDLFSQCVARQVSEVLDRMGGGSVLELGAGTGRLAMAVLSTLASLGSLPEQYAILEVSADLRERQRARIAQLPAEARDRVVWLDALPSQPVRGAILANEALDALPAAWTRGRAELSLDTSPSISRSCAALAVDGGAIPTPSSRTPSPRMTMR